jgi:very-short-patch-repair endonuclease
MEKLIVASEALATGTLTRQILRTRYVKLHHNVYAQAGIELDAVDRAKAAWLWSRRKATLVGNSAAALLGTRWLPPDAPAELARGRCSAPTGIVVHSGSIALDEICMAKKGMNCTTPARTAYDIGRRVPDDRAIVRIDALFNATRCTVAEVEHIAARYCGARGMRQLRKSLALVDAGAESPQETRLRLLLVRAGLPRPITQIPVGNRRVDMGWPQWKLGVEYDGMQHWTDPAQHAEDIDRLEFLAAQGWTIVRVSARQLRYRPELVIDRVRAALRQYV